MATSIPPHRTRRPHHLLPPPISHLLRSALDSSHHGGDGGSAAEFESLLDTAVCAASELGDYLDNDSGVGDGDWDNEDDERIKLDARRSDVRRMLGHAVSEASEAVLSASDVAAAQYGDEGDRDAARTAIYASGCRMLTTTFEEVLSLSEAAEAESMEAMEAEEGEAISREVYGGESREYGGPPDGQARARAREDADAPYAATADDRDARALALEAAQAEAYAAIARDIAASNEDDDVLRATADDRDARALDLEVAQAAAIARGVATTNEDDGVLRVETAPKPAHRHLPSFDTSIGSMGSHQEESRSLSQLIWSAKNKDIRYLQGGRDPSRDKERFELYLKTINSALSDRVPKLLRESAVGQRLYAAREEGRELATDRTRDRRYGEAAWAMRHALNAMQARQNDRALVLCAVRRSDTAGGEGQREEDEINAEDVDELGQAQELADSAYLLRQCIHSRHCTWFRDSYSDCFEASDAVEVLSSLGFGVRNRNEASSKTCARLVRGGFLRPVSHPHEQHGADFRDGTRLFRFGTREEMNAMFHRPGGADDGGGAQMERPSEGRVLRLALHSTLAMPEPMESDTLGADGSISGFSSSSGSGFGHGRGGGDSAVFADVPTRLLRRRATATTGPEQMRGRYLADLTSRVEQSVDIADRRYHLRTYRRCFVGRDAVTKLVEVGVFGTRQEATSRLRNLVDAGLIRHVKDDHPFKDDRLFYRFVTAPEIRAVLDEQSRARQYSSSDEQRGQLQHNISAQSVVSSVRGRDLVLNSALVLRYKQYCGFQVKAILNDFYESGDQSSWDDESNFEAWRTNMKRWGFARGGHGRDEETVDRLATYVRDVDPEQWQSKGDDEWEGQWESPFGILAQVAIFHVIPRALLKGRHDAVTEAEGYRWDSLAIHASKQGLRKGYFDSAYNSALNQLLLLLPLSHSPSWEDRKLGVALLLQLLPNLSAQSPLAGGGSGGGGSLGGGAAGGGGNVSFHNNESETWSDLEVIKRIEFTKGLSAAVLEFSRAVATHQRRYGTLQDIVMELKIPLEERIWDAADRAERKMREGVDVEDVMNAEVIPRRRKIN